VKCCRFGHGLAKRPEDAEARWHVMVPAAPKRPTGRPGAKGKGDPRSFNQVCDACLIEHLDNMVDLHPDARIEVWAIRGRVT